MLSVDKISTYYFSRILALDEVTVNLNQGEVICVIGANGAGKTTLLNSICGITPIKRGKVTFLNENIHRLSPVAIVRKGISLVPEGRRVFGPLTVKENLLMGAYVRKKRDTKEKIQEDLENMYQIFPILGKREKQLAGMLSGGEQQMLSLARSLMSRPRLLLLDEPSMGLAPLVVREIFCVLERLKEENTTILLVEQNARIALKLSDRGYVLERGRLIAQGKSEDLLKDKTIKKAYLGE